jgi:maltooligosyltrehalose trehalohydrolase
MEKRFTVWAPFAKTMTLMLDGTSFEMDRCDLGYWFADGPVEAGVSEYFFIIDGTIKANDPRVKFLPYGQNGLGVYFEASDFHWSDSGFKGQALESAVIYELHVGSFSSVGRYEGVKDKLTHLKELGITHIEFMPLGSFSSGKGAFCGWGYDSIFPYAPHAAYGHPFELMDLIDSCHGLGLSVIIDLVMNHFGPSGAVQGLFGPYTTDTYKTPWGRAINFDGAYSYEVRRYFIDCALMWLDDYHFDGVRIDATHAIFDQSALSIMTELNDAIDQLGQRLGKSFIKIAESDLNDPRLVSSKTCGGYGFDAQWSDDFHHALHAYMTRESLGYYQDFGDFSQVKKAFCQGFVYAGDYSKYRKAFKGQALPKNAATKLITYIQNHDQIGNRGFGERLSHLVHPSHLYAMAAINLLAPTVPMIFQGEEWGSKARFLYFTSHADEGLSKAVFEGRKREFKEFFSDENALESLLDPQSDEAFLTSKLDWKELSSGNGKDLFQWYQRMILLRRRYISCNKQRDFLDEASIRIDDDKILQIQIGRLWIIVNLADHRLSLDKPNEQRAKALAIKGQYYWESGCLALGAFFVGVFLQGHS